MVTGIEEPRKEGGSLVATQFRSCLSITAGTWNLLFCFLCSDRWRKEPLLPPLPLKPLWLLQGNLLDARDVAKTESSNAFIDAHHSFKVFREKIGNQETTARRMPASELSVHISSSSTYMQITLNLWTFIYTHKGKPQNKSSSVQLLTIGWRAPMVFMEKMEAWWFLWRKWRHENWQKT